MKYSREFLRNTNMSSGVKQPALAANYMITLRWYNKPPLYLTARFGSREAAEQYAADFAKRQYAVDYKVEMIH